MEIKMDELISNFPGHIREAMEIGKAATVNHSAEKVRNVVITGMGGSGIGANLVTDLYGNDLFVPVIINKNYFLPTFADKHTVVIFNSYSGNTEETLHVLSAAMHKGCKIVCITSGGKLAEITKAEKFDLVTVPGGMPPRATLAYSFTVQLYVLNKLGLLPLSFEQHLLHAAGYLQSHQKDIRADAENWADKLAETIPVLYIDSGMESVALRFRQQINENAKMLSWHHVLPEMNHNELVGWRNNNEQVSVVFLRNDSDYKRVQLRMEMNVKLLENVGVKVYEMRSTGESKTEKALSLIHLGDWISYYLAIKQNIDPVEVNVLESLKQELAKSPEF